MICEQIQELYQTACEILNDFDNYGEVLQTDINGEYGKEATIEKLRTAVENTTQ